MKGFTVLLFLAGVASAMVPASAIGETFPTITIWGNPPDPHLFPRFEIGTMIGRQGAAFGEGVLAQVNFGALGVSTFGGSSSVHGYQADGGVRANFFDRTAGVGVNYTLITMRQRWRFGPYFQLGYDGSKVKASYFDPDYGVNVPYREIDRNILPTAGLQVEYRPTTHTSVFVRAGRNFGDSFAAQTAGGISLNVGFRVAMPGIHSEIRNAFARIIK